MTNRRYKNIAASVRQRLLNNARETNRPFAEVLQYFAMERFLYRLTKSPYSENLILKGALMLIAWEAPLTRPTMDIDMLGRIENDVDNIVSIIQEICLKEVEPDGIIFDTDSVAGERIREDADYEGIRVRFKGSLDTAQFTMQLDIGFGDVVVPSVEATNYPTILDLPVPHLQGYSKESMIAEKFEAMIKLGVLNSRMKDFFDIWLLSRQFDFDGTTLAKAIAKTFSTRGTDLQPDPTAFGDTFAKDATKDSQWRGFIRKNRMENTPHDFEEIVNAVSAFLKPIADCLSKSKDFTDKWNPPGPWQK